MILYCLLIHHLFDTLDTFCDYCIARTTQTLVEIPAFFYVKKKGFPSFDQFTAERILLNS